MIRPRTSTIRPCRPGRCGTRSSTGCGTLGSLPDLGRRFRAGPRSLSRAEIVGPRGEDVGMSAELTVAPLAELRRRRSAKWRTFPDDVLPLFVAETDYDLAPPVADVLHEALRRSDTGYPLPEPEFG